MESNDLDALCETSAADTEMKRLFLALDALGFPRASEWRTVRVLGYSVSMKSKINTGVSGVSRKRRDIFNESFGFDDDTKRWLWIGGGFPVGGICGYSYVAWAERNPGKDLESWLSLKDVELAGTLPAQVRNDAHVGSRSTDPHIIPSSDTTDCCTKCPLAGCPLSLQCALIRKLNSLSEDQPTTMDPIDSPPCGGI